MKSFVWNMNFMTGLQSVDSQHKILVNIINKFGDLLATNKIGFADIDSTFSELAEYTKFHFKDEEELMLREGVDPRHTIEHIKTHTIFLAEVVEMRAGISKDNLVPAKNLLSFLVHWLAYHILGSDLNMSRQIMAIKSGVDSATAYENEEKEADNATEALLTALNGLFSQVSQRNKELIKLNQSLEDKVARRTNELSEANKHLEEISSTDALTGLANRRHAMRSLSCYWLESEKDATPLSCIMIDADHFKEVNDTYGHDAGDVVLKELAKTLEHSFRSDDVVCRLGGDEFFIICPNTDASGAHYIAELAHKKVSELRVITGGDPWIGSISVGVASKDGGMSGYENLIKRADEGLYAAKKDGKNCVRMLA